MWKLSLPENSNAIEELRKALTRKNKGPVYRLSSEEEARIRTIYQEYEIARGAASVAFHGIGIQPQLAEAIADGYKHVQNSGRLSTLRDRLFLRVDRCPLCGITSVSELDHHLPRSTYKVLAVYSSNLIPVCHVCNNRKGTLSGDNPNASFSHVYYFNIPDDVQFFYALVSLPEKGLDVKFEVRRVPGMTEQLFKQIEFQIERIQLNERLKKEISVRLGDIAFGLRSGYESGGADNVKKFLKGTSEEVKRRSGINDWWTVLLVSLCENDEFCDGGFYRVLSLDRNLTSI